MRALRFVGRTLVELGRGFGLIVRDIHQFLYRRLKARTWWIYIGVAFVVALLATGQLWNFVLQILTFIILIGLFLLIGKAALRKLFGGVKQDKKR